MVLCVYLHATRRQCVLRTAPVCVSRSMREMGSRVKVKTFFSSLFKKKKHRFRNKEQILIFIPAFLLNSTSHISSHVLFTSSYKYVPALEWGLLKKCQMHPERRESKLHMSEGLFRRWICLYAGGPMCQKKQWRLQ